ncbi:Protein of unknown function DUF2232, membrane [Thermoanaerobacterium xylanolyticum LX-11]|uniref:DUF2232 domain-containing protein n=1 Tax=Thermoanaerobacterium xylanolyticum (strain ATCC 49914 / DSM 7097 / LX-11) TaxID=858215 RepID=F6BFS9_THEXL|nr:DUF2232 domain-containing protein [Thermoanaerobacterium xylanolyticum]AEF18383.1 Protein of unknown function DUF2232, membrane [Thermoanaerobacterium xylanolyticum LX-11]
MSSKNIVNGALMVAVAVIMVLIGSYVPPLFFILFFVSVPVSVVVIRNNSLLYGILTTVLIFIATFLFTDIITASIVAALSAIGIAMGYFIKNGSTPQDVVIETGAISLVGFVGALYVLKLFRINVIKSILYDYQQIGNQILDIYKNSPDAAYIRNMISYTLESLKELMPSIFVIMIVLIVLANYMLLSRIMAREGKVKKLPPFMFWRMPYMTGWIFIGALLYQYFVNSSVVASNLLLLLSIGFTVSGLSYVKYFMTKRFNVSSLISDVILVALFMFPITFSLMTLLGVIDTSMNLRRFT